MSHIGALLPQMLADIEITPSLLATVHRWYRAKSSADTEAQKRAVTASHFINYGFVADDIEQFIHFFVALDALFGIRGKVETSIFAGIEKTFPAEKAWAERARRLFELRSELLHGGSSTVKAWPEYEEYRRHFKTEPQRDVTVMATTALQRFFN